MEIDVASTLREMRVDQAAQAHLLAADQAATAQLLAAGRSALERGRQLLADPAFRPGFHWSAHWPPLSGRLTAVA
jgi:hypothetical protein